MIRVIGGLYRGRKLKKVKDPEVRPITDRVKETLFNIIQDDVRSSVFLDGFAGTGSVGIEAFSRGAKEVVFIEHNYQAVKIIKHNLAKCGIETNYQVIRQEFNRAVIQLAKENQKFDIIFLDPPYKLIEERNPLRVIKKREILKPEGVIILRHFFKTRFDPKYFKLYRRVTIGSDTLSFYK
ncbi:MAG: 16S rRNA (guanine(966)-N(2))-methyltransferase RsmD [Candidatus Aminicenantia bacterium]